MKGLRIPAELPPWREVVTDAAQQSWYPLRLDLSIPAHAAAKDELTASGEVVHVHDTIDA